MRRGRLALWAVAAACVCGCSAQEPLDPLTMSQAVPLPGVVGRIDHFAVDLAGKRLFVAALGNNSVEVVDLRTNLRAGTISELSEPQGVAYLPEADEVAVANGGDGTVRFFAARSLARTRSVDFKSDADNLRCDPAAKRLWVGFASALGVMDASGRRLGEVRLAGHPESFQLESHGRRIFVNVPSAGQVAVVDREKLEVVATWPLTEGAANYPMALDEEHHRLFVGCRSPARLLVLDTETGKVAARIDCVGDADDVFYDAAAARVYVSGGGGAVDVFAQADAGRYTLDSRTATAPGARTSLLIPEMKLLCVAVPRSAGRDAEIRLFRLP